MASSTTNSNVVIQRSNRSLTADTDTELKNEGHTLKIAAEGGATNSSEESEYSIECFSTHVDLSLAVSYDHVHLVSFLTAKVWRACEYDFVLWVCISIGI